jgi:CBS domain-containing protein
MIPRPRLTSTNPDFHTFAMLMRRLGETFAVHDVMVRLPDVEYVAPGNVEEANRIVAQKRFSVVPVSKDGKKFESVFGTEHPPNSARTITKMQATSVSDHIPDSTPLAEAFYLFETREWYLTLRGNQVSGLITYWAFNSREFRVQLYAGLSRVEELSRDVLAKDGCGLSDETGVNLSAEVLDRVRQRFNLVQQQLGGNRFVDELEFHQIHDALRKHSPWRDFLHQRLGRTVANKEYEKIYNFTDLRNAVMHGRTLFPAYRDFKKCTSTISKIGELIDHLDAYIASSASDLSALSA